MVCLHEWALAESIVMYLRNQGVSKARKLTIYLGRLQSIDKEVLIFALSELLKNEELSISEIGIVEEDPVLACRTCGYTWSLDMKSLSEDVVEALHFLPEVVHIYHRCPRCGSRDFEVVKGRGLSRIEVIVE